jgi:hypothetical protein
MAWVQRAEEYLSFAEIGGGEVMAGAVGQLDFAPGDGACGGQRVAGVHGHVHGCLGEGDFIFHAQVVFPVPPEVHRVKCERSEPVNTKSFAFPPEVHRVKYKELQPTGRNRFAFPPEVHRVKCFASNSANFSRFAFPPEVHRVKYSLPIRLSHLRHLPV